MNMFTFAPIALKDIDDTGKYNLHPFLEPAEASAELKASVAVCGILSPPLVVATADGGYELICGRQRLHCAGAISGNSSCHCAILPETASVENILACVIEDQFAAGGLSIMEQAVFVALCHDLIGDENRREGFLRSLLPGRITKGSRFLLRLAQLDDGLKKAVHTQRVSERVLGELQNLDRNGQLRFVRLAEEINLGGNQQRKLISQLADLCARENISLDHLLHDHRLRKILEDRRSAPPQKAGRFIEAVARMSRPRLIQATESFTTEVEALNLPPHCKLTPSPSFEKDEVHFTARFANLVEFKKFWQEMEDSVGKEP